MGPEIRLEWSKQQIGRQEEIRNVDDLSVSLFTERRREEPIASGDANERLVVAGFVGFLKEI